MVCCGFCCFCRLKVLYDSVELGLSEGLFEVVVLWFLWDVIFDGMIWFWVLCVVCGLYRIEGEVRFLWVLMLFMVRLWGGDVLILIGVFIFVVCDNGIEVRWWGVGLRKLSFFIVGMSLYVVWWGFVMGSGVEVFFGVSGFVGFELFIVYIVCVLLLGVICWGFWMLEILIVGLLVLG